MTAIQDVPLKTLTGNDSRLGDFAGQVLLVVNVASQCGLTPQYAGLQALYEKYKDEGFAILGFPSNDFAGQEPGSDAEIGAFCSSTYGVTFPMFSKIAVVGSDKHPLYRELVSAAPVAEGTGALRAKFESRGMTPNPEPEILWNFEKFLIGRDGEVAARFAPDTAPDDDRLIRAIERELFTSE